MRKLREQLKSNREFNPFNDLYNKDKVINLLLSYSKQNVDYETEKILLTYFSSLPISDYFKNVFSEFKSLLLQSGLTKEILFDFLIANVNRNFLGVSRLRIEEYLNNTLIHYEESHSWKIDSIDPGIGKVEAAGALESNIDELNIKLNFIKRIKDEIIEKGSGELSELQTINTLISIVAGIGYYQMIKSNYEDSVWNNGFVEYDFENKKMIMDFFSPDDLIINKVGFIRFSRNTMTYFFAFKNILLSNDNFIKDFKGRNYWNLNLTINKVFIKEGIITFELTKGFNKDELSIFANNESHILAHYRFVTQEVLPKLQLNVEEMVYIWSSIQFLFKEVVKSSYELTDDSINTFKDFYKFPIKINISNLKSYLYSKLNFERIKIDNFLSILINPENERINFWKYPFYKDNSFLLFPLITITSPLLPYLLDHWIDIGGINLDTRGDYFEEFVKKELFIELQDKNYEFLISPISTFTNINEESEEIDLVINFKAIVLIAEIKCIKYPLDIRDKSNAVKRLTEGAEQVNRKAKFLIENASQFKKDIGEISGKEIVKLVLTNFPIFTGLVLSSVPIADYALLESYISYGKLSKEVTISNNDTPLFQAFVKENVYYQDEVEFCKNFRSFFEKPLPVEELKKMVELAYYKISPIGADIELYARGATFTNTKL